MHIKLDTIPVLDQYEKMISRGDGWKNIAIQNAVRVFMLAYQVFVTNYILYSLMIPSGTYAIVGAVMGGRDIVCGLQE